MTVSDSMISTSRLSAVTPQTTDPSLHVSAASFVAAGLMLRASPLWKEVKTFSGWFENECRAVDSSGNQEALRIEISCEGFARLAAGDGLTPLQSWRRLWVFLSDLGIRRLDLDPRLESNQVSDILTLIFANRRGLKMKKPQSVNSVASRLRGDNGVTFACAVTKIEGDVLSVSYSYCMTRFSRVVAWFKNARGISRTIERCFALRLGTA